MKAERIENGMKELTKGLQTCAPHDFIYRAAQSQFGHSVHCTSLYGSDRFDGQGVDCAQDGNLARRFDLFHESHGRSILVRHDLDAGTRQTLGDEKAKLVVGYHAWC